MSGKMDAKEFYEPVIKELQDRNTNLMRQNDLLHARMSGMESAMKIMMDEKEMKRVELIVDKLITVNEEK